MKGALFLFRVPRRIQRRLCTEIRTWVLPVPIMAWLWLINHLGKAAVVSGEGPVVSLTTYGKRIRTVYFAIESISRGRKLPSRLILWIDDPVLFGNLPFSLRRLMKRGLEVKLCKNYGPHTKYYPYLEVEKELAASLVTADDDVLYPRNWLAALVVASARSPNTVVCYRAHVVVIDGVNVSPYRSWKPCCTTTPSLQHFATGVSGALYPPTVLECFRRAGAGFVEFCPKADDVWLHAQTIRAGFRVSQIGASPRHFWTILGTQEIALWRSNCQENDNDRQITATYTAADIEIMKQGFSLPFAGKGDRYAQSSNQATASVGLIIAERAREARDF
jgi:hypothetical protein